MSVDSPPASAALASPPYMHVDRVSLGRGGTQVFDGLSLHLHEPHIGLIGDNGAGKTSLLRLLCGLDVPQSGQVRFMASDINTAGAQRSKWVGMMFQNPDDQIIFPTVQEELALGLQPLGYAKREARAKVLAFLQARGLSHWAARAVHSLSQGQRQLVCWMAMLLATPRTLLLDEPYASLDLPGQARLADDIMRCGRQVIVSTHVLAHVRHYPRVIWLHDGAIMGDGPGAEVCAAYEGDVARRIAGELAGNGAR